MKTDILYPVRKLHGYIHEYKLYQKNKHSFYKSYIKPIKEKLRHTPKLFFLVLTPEHGNMGDHAIAVSEAQLLNRLDYEYVEITGHMLTYFEQYNYLDIMNGHPIMINGGGNMGTLWFDAERIHRSIMQSNPNSPIFLMPNSMFYEKSDYGKSEFHKSIQIYNAHPNLYLFAREAISYNAMKQVYRNVTLIPDMVLALNECKEQTQRKGCLLCLRTDHERTIDDAALQVIQEQAQQLFGQHVKHTDMNIGKCVPIMQRDTALNEKYSEFRSAELVITDRLHGMIFCAITGTPCILINSRSPKVRGSFEWVRDLGYIKFAEDPLAISELYHSIPRCIHSYDNANLLPYYDELYSIIYSVLNSVS